MSELTDRRAAWQTKEAARQLFFLANAVDAANYKSIMDHKREGDVLSIAEEIVANGNYNGLTPGIATADPNMIAEAEALAASAGE